MSTFQTQTPTAPMHAQVLTPEEWQAWHVVYHQAASSLEDREARIAAVAEKLETNFELIGVTAIEDKLQARVNLLHLAVSSLPGDAWHAAQPARRTPKQHGVNMSVVQGCFRSRGAWQCIRMLRDDARRADGRLPARRKECRTRSRR